MKERRPLRFHRSCPTLSLGILTWSYYDGNTRKNVRNFLPSWAEWIKWRLPGFSSWLRGKKSACQCRGHRFNPWSGKIPLASDQLSQCATTAECKPEPGSRSYWSPCTQEPALCSERSTTGRSTLESLRSAAREAPRGEAHARACALQREKHHREKRTHHN